MTSAANCLTTGFDGTAALKASPRTNLVLIEGGRCASRAPRSVSSRLSVRQACAFLFAGVLLIAALGLVATLSEAISSSSLQSALGDLPESVLVVSDGDTLWSIASSVEVDGVSTSDVVSWICERNDLSDALLVAGQRLVIPSPASM